MLFFSWYEHNIWSRWICSLAHKQINEEKKATQPTSPLCFTVQIKSLNRLECELLSKMKRMKQKKQRQREKNEHNIITHSMGHSVCEMLLHGDLIANGFIRTKHESNGIGILIWQFGFSSIRHKEIQLKLNWNWTGERCRHHNSLLKRRKKKSRIQNGIFTLGAFVSCPCPHLWNICNKKLVVVDAQRACRTKTLCWQAIWAKPFENHLRNEFAWKTWIENMESVVHCSANMPKVARIGHSLSIDREICSWIDGATKSRSKLEKKIWNSLKIFPSQSQL